MRFIYPFHIRPETVYDLVLTVTGGLNKWCSPWLTSADGGATEESLRRQRTVNPRNCGSPCASRDPRAEVLKITSYSTISLPPPPTIRESALPTLPVSIAAMRL